MNKPEDAVQVILVEDDEDLSAELAFTFHLAGFDVRTARSGPELNRLLTATTRGVIVLDMGLPGEDGLSIAQRLSGLDHLRIVALTGRDGRQDRIDGANAGVDVYLTKPPNLEELIAVVRRGAKRLPNPQQRLVLDKVRQILLVPNGQTINLTTQECWFLCRLAEEPDNAATRHDLENAIWKSELTLTDKRLDALVHRLRAKLADASPELAEMIITQRGRGFALLQSIATICAHSS